MPGQLYCGDMHKAVKTLGSSTQSGGAPLTNRRRSGAARLRGCGSATRYPGEAAVPSGHRFRLPTLTARTPAGTTPLTPPTRRNLPCSCRGISGTAAPGADARATSCSPPPHTRRRAQGPPQPLCSAHREMRGPMAQRSQHTTPDQQVPSSSPGGGTRIPTLSPARGCLPAPLRSRKGRVMGRRCPAIARVLSRRLRSRVWRRRGGR